jgi:hypothetical protein
MRPFHYPLFVSSAIEPVALFKLSNNIRMHATILAEWKTHSDKSPIINPFGN